MWQALWMAAYHNDTAAFARAKFDGADINLPRDVSVARRSRKARGKARQDRTGCLSRRSRSVGMPLAAECRDSRLCVDSRSWW